MNSSKDKDSQSEEVSENDISDFTNNHVFRGGLGLLQPNNQSKPPLMITSNNNPQIQHPILQSLARPEGNITIPNSSLYSSGFLSFRNKKANILNPQGLNCSNNKIEENVDPAAVTQSILEKLNSFKESSHNMIMSIENTTPGRKDKYNNEQKEIGKLFKNNNNDSKPIEEECETKDINYIHTNSSNKDSMKLNSTDIKDVLINCLVINKNYWPFINNNSFEINNIEPQIDTTSGLPLTAYDNFLQEIRKHIDYYKTQFTKKKFCRNLSLYSNVGYANMTLTFRNGEFTFVVSPLSGFIIKMFDKENKAMFPKYTIDYIAEKLKADAENYLGEKVTERLEAVAEGVYA